MVRKCIVVECLSASSRPEDQGVTFHKFPVNETTKLQWLSQCHMPLDVQNKIMYVCSRHFRRVDFQTFKGTKYMLKTGAIPSMFPWGRTPDSELDKMKNETSKVKVNDKLSSDATITTASTDDTENDTSEANVEDNNDTTNEKTDTKSTDIPVKNNVVKSKVNKTTSKATSKQPASAKLKKKRKLDSSLSVSAPKAKKKSNLIITSTPKIKLFKKKIKNPKTKVVRKVVQNVKEEIQEKVEVPNPPQVPEVKFDLTAINFVSGTCIEAKDFNEQWVAAKVLEVDYEENEILIQFETNRSDEWIPMNSPRLRPIQKPPKPVVMFKVGEHCFARWTDSRKFPATVQRIMENDHFEVLFDDGFVKVVPAAHMSKIRNKTPQANINKKNIDKPKKPIAKTITKQNTKPIRGAPPAESNNTIVNRNNKSTVENKAKSTGNKIKVKRVIRKTGSKNDNDNVKGNANISKNNIDLNSTKISNMDNNIESTEDTDSADEVESEKAQAIEETNSELPPGEWCCQWLDGVPVGKPGIIDAMEGVRNTVIVDDTRLPHGWIKHVVQRHTGSSAGKWDVILVSPQNRKFRSRKEIEAYFEERKELYNPNNFDFSLHKKRAKEIGWDKVSSAKRRRISSEIDVKTEAMKSPELPTGPSEESISLEQSEVVLEEGYVMVGSLKVQIIDNLFRCPESACGKNFRKENLLQMHIKHYHRHLTKFLGSTPNVADLAYARTVRQPIEPEVPKNRYSNAQFYEKISKIDTQSKRVKPPLSPLVKIESPETEETETEINDDLKETSASVPLDQDVTIKQENENALKKPIVEPEENVCVKPTNLPESNLEININEESKLDSDKESELKGEINNSQGFLSPETLYRKCSALEAELNSNKPIVRHVSFDPEKTIVHRYEEQPKPTGIKRLLPVRRTLEKVVNDDVAKTDTIPEVIPDADVFVRPLAVGNTKYKRKGNKLGRKQYEAGLLKKLFTRDKKQNWERKMRGRKLSELHHRGPMTSNYLKPMPSTPQLISSSYSNIDDCLTPVETNLQPLTVNTIAESQILPERSESPKYITEDGEKIKLVHMRREEIINCICRYCEEDGLMVQCELCLCWQHATCLGIEKESEVPDKYVCYICLNPPNIRESQRYLHDQDWLIEGKLPTMGMSRKENLENKQSKEEFIKKVNEITGFIYELMPGIHTLQCKINIVEQKNHPKLYCWAKPWHDVKSEEQRDTEVKTDMKESLVEIEESQMESEIVQDEDFEQTIESSISEDNKNIMDELFIKSGIERSPIKNNEKDIQHITNLDHMSNIDSISTSIDESNTDVLEALVKSDVFSELDAHVDISAILESNDPIPSDSELVSILEGDIKTGNTMGTSGEIKSQSDEMECDNDLVKDNPINMEFFNLLNDDIKLASINKTKESDLKDDQTLLANLNVSPEETKFDLFSAGSKFDLLAACDDSEDNFIPSPVVSQVPKAPEPEEAIDTENCRRNLLEHISRAQDKYEMLLEQLQEQVTDLMTKPFESDMDKRMAKTKLMIKMMMRDMDTLNDISNIPDDEPERVIVATK